MSRKQENLTNSETSTSKIKKSFSSKMFIGAEIPKPFEAVSRTDGYFKLVSPPKSKFFMPKPRISYHCNDAPTALNNKFQVKPMVGFKKHSKVTVNHTMIEDLNKNASTISGSFPVVPGKPEQYKPTLYTFRIPTNTASSASTHSSVRCPPFYVQLDHTLAVVWSLFSIQSTEKPLGLVQLQWALNFLQGVRNGQGKHPKDVAVCIEALEEALISQYAAVANTVKPSATSSRRASSNKFERSSLASVKKSSSLFPNLAVKTPQPGILTAQKFPFSVTYDEMSKKRPNRVEQLFKAKGGVSMTGADIQRQLNNFKNFNSEIIIGKACSREDMVEFLKGWRKEQINKLQEELQRLHSIETFIGTVDKDNFKPCLETQQVDALVGHKSKNGKSNGGSNSSSSLKMRSERRKSSKTK